MINSHNGEINEQIFNPTPWPLHRVFVIQLYTVYKHLWKTYFKIWFEMFMLYLPYRQFIYVTWLNESNSNAAYLVANSDARH